MGWGSSTRRGGGCALPRKFVFIGLRREESVMSREFCQDVPWECSKTLCKKVCAHFSFPKHWGGTNRVFVPCQKGAVLTKSAKMTNVHSTGSTH